MIWVCLPLEASFGADLGDPTGTAMPKIVNLDPALFVSRAYLIYDLQTVLAGTLLAVTVSAYGAIK